MKHYGHLCLKRTLLWSTSETLSALDLGPIDKKKDKSLVKTALKYQDSKGKTRYKGNGAVLKNTQLLVSKRLLFWELSWNTIVPVLVSELGLGACYLRLYPAAFVGRILEHKALFLEAKPRFPQVR